MLYQETNVLVEVELQWNNVNIQRMLSLVKRVKMKKYIFLQFPCCVMCKRRNYKCASCLIYLFFLFFFVCFFGCIRTTRWHKLVNRKGKSARLNVRWRRSKCTLAHLFCCRRVKGMCCYRNSLPCLLGQCVQPVGWKGEASVHTGVCSNSFIWVYIRRVLELTSWQFTSWSCAHHAKACTFTY